MHARMAIRRQQQSRLVREKRKKRNKQRTENFMRRLRGKFRRFHVRRQHNVVFVVVVVFVDLRVVVEVLFSTTHHKAFRARRFGQGRRAKSKSQSIIRLIGCHRLLLSLSLSLPKVNRDDMCSLSLSLSLSSRRARGYTSTLSLSLSLRARLSREMTPLLMKSVFRIGGLYRDRYVIRTQHTHTHTRTTHNNIRFCLVEYTYGLRSVRLLYSSKRLVLSIMRERKRQQKNKKKM